MIRRPQYSFLRDTCLFHLKSLLVAQVSAAPAGLRSLWLWCARRRIGHFDVRHLSVFDKVFICGPLGLSRGPANQGGGA